jgi:hypothetical protein
MLTTAALAISLSLAPALSAGAVPAVTAPQEKVIVKLMSVQGGGCTQGTTSVEVSPDNTSISLGFSDFTAGTGAGMKVTDSRRNCHISLTIQAPSGFMYAISTARYAGYAGLEPKASGFVRASFYFAGIPETRLAEHSLAGPSEENWAFEDTTDLPGLVWTSCGERRYYNFSFELRVRAGTSDAATTSNIISFNSSGNDSSTTYQLEWKRCPA